MISQCKYKFGRPATTVSGQTPQTCDGVLHLSALRITLVFVFRSLRACLSEVHPGFHGVQRESIGLRSLQLSTGVVNMWFSSADFHHCKWLLNHVPTMVLSNSPFLHPPQADSGRWAESMPSIYRVHMWIRANLPQAYLVKAIIHGSKISHLTYTAPFLRILDK